MKPLFAVAVWLVEETITVAYPDGQEISIPVSEAQRLVTMLRSQSVRGLTPKVTPDWRRAFAKAFTDEDISKAGAKARAKLVPKAKLKMSPQEADKILKSIGL